MPGSPSGCIWVFFLPALKLPSVAFTRKLLKCVIQKQYQSRKKQLPAGTQRDAEPQFLTCTVSSVPNWILPFKGQTREKKVMGATQLNRILLTNTMMEHIDQASLHNLSDRCLGKPTHSKRDMAAASKLLLLWDLLTEPCLVAQTRVGIVGNTHADTQRKEITCILIFTASRKKQQRKRQ